jgi:hypothetical protein
MSYQYLVSIPNSTPVVVTETSVLGGLSTASFHTIQCSGDAVLVEMQIGNNTNYVTIEAALDDAIENMNAYGVTAIRLTVASGTATVSICGAFI